MPINQKKKKKKKKKQKQKEQKEKTYINGIKKFENMSTFF